MLSRYLASQVKNNSYFLAGLALGLWVALVAVPLDEELESCVAAPELLAVSAPSHDDFEPQHEERAPDSGSGAARSVQRPRYYSTELGMRARLLAGVLSSEAQLAADGRVPAINRTAARLQPALRFFITAREMKAAPGLANVVGFTDTREMLKPFHALKYLADNYLEEYDFFFLVSDTTFMNTRRLTDLVSRLSVSQDVYMGNAAEDDSEYCSLEGGILLSNSVVRAVHAQLDWCVRNSYSAQHHENIGRCVLHAAHTRCTPRLQGRRYEVAAGVTGAAGGHALWRAVTAHPAPTPRHFYQLHAHVARMQLEAGLSEMRRARAAVWRLARRLPAGARNGTWPGGLRADPGLAPPAPASRHDYTRWVAFNDTHAMLLDDRSGVAPLPTAHAAALGRVLAAVGSWAERRWGGPALLVEGAWQWEPAVAMRYRLLLRPADGRMRLVEAVRPLGAARLAPVPYVTESARVLLVLPVTAREAALLPGFLARYEAVALDRDRNTALLLVAVRDTLDAPDSADTLLHDVSTVARALSARRTDAHCDVLQEDAPPPDHNKPESGAARWERVSGAALRAAAAARGGGGGAGGDALLLLARPDMEFNEEFLNRVRMNTIAGRQWFLPVPYARDALPRAAGGSGRFNPRRRDLLAVYCADLRLALSQWEGVGGVAAQLARSALHALVAPEPGLLLPSPAAPCPARNASAGCLRAERDAGLPALELGARHALARLLLEHQARGEPGV